MVLQVNIQLAAREMVVKPLAGGIDVVDDQIIELGIDDHDVRPVISEGIGQGRTIELSRIEKKKFP